MGNAQSGNSLNNASLALTIWATFTVIKSGLHEVRKAVVSHYPHDHLEKINITFAEARELVINGDQRERLGDLEVRRILLSQDVDDAWNATRWWDWERYLPSTYREIARRCEELRKDIDEFVDSLLVSGDRHSTVTPPLASISAVDEFQTPDLPPDLPSAPPPAVSPPSPRAVSPPLPPAVSGAPPAAPHPITSPASPTGSSSTSSGWDRSTAVSSTFTTPAPDESSAPPVQDIELAQEITSATGTLEVKRDTEARRGGADAENAAEHAAATDKLPDTPVDLIIPQGHTTSVEATAEAQVHTTNNMKLRKSPSRSPTDPEERDSRGDRNEMAY
ncbi:hypothetical protein C2E23DRAFT_615865 [Lenzites betulinus]|nr:hypothetical protein C2E23DRAFT_615865 [Lenzites betulinus]